VILSLKTQIQVKKGWQDEQTANAQRPTQFSDRFSGGMER
jgi:hypothetical protein